jgi:hypothetical protein
MPQRDVWESIKIQGDQLVEQLKKLIHEGNVRRVVVKQGAKTVAEFPLTVGVVGAVVAPMLAAVAALAAALTDCTVVVERRSDAPAPAPRRKARRA